MFLTTIRRTGYLALTKKQVIHKRNVSRSIRDIKNEKNNNLYMNGQISYSLYNNYIKEATKYKIALL
ncbi:DUF1694 domain-containing protein [Anaerobacillus sp. HL2]|nr:DUF1694 domain-containing protein [Anaerobacillus sp. HL2]